MNEEACLINWRVDPTYKVDIVKCCVHKEIIWFTLLWLNWGVVMVSLQPIHGLKNNIWGETWDNKINFGVIADRSCAYFDHGADGRCRNIALKRLWRYPFWCPFLSPFLSPFCSPFWLGLHLRKVWFDAKHGLLLFLVVFNIEALFCSSLYIRQNTQ